jgi:DNA-binding Lrp family transcriptional regulator
LQISRDHWFGDQVALEAIVRFTDEELKHQALFRRIEKMVAQGMPQGYVFKPEPNAVAGAVMAASSWAVLALTCHIELFTQVHYRMSIEPDDELSPLYKDVFLFHWKEESQHAIIDELEWRRENARLSEVHRDQAVDDLIGLVVAVDGILQMQAPADAEYFANACGTALSADERGRVADCLLDAYRWQYIVSGVQDTRFQEALASMANPTQLARIGLALAPLLH